MTLFATLLASAILTNLAEVASSLRENRSGERAEVDAVVSFLEDKGDRSFTLGLKDATGEVLVWLTGKVFDASRPRLGDRVRVFGDVVLTQPYLNMVFICNELRILSHGPVPAPRPVSAREIRGGACDDRLVSVRGTVVDSFRDEIDTHVYFIILDCDRETVYACLISPNDLSDRLRPLDGAEVEVRGICSPGGGGQRRISGHIVNAINPDNVRVIRSPADRFDAPALQPKSIASPADVIRLGRRRVRGTVIATWQRNRALMRMVDGVAVTLELSNSQPLPEYGQFVEAVGFAETDLYHINLSHVLWRPATDSSVRTAEQAQRLSARALLTDGEGRFRVNPLFHGKAVSLDGLVKDVVPDGTFVLESDGIALPIDASAHPSALDGVLPGSKVAVTGICVLDVETWKPYGSFPHARGYTLVLRTPDDLTVLAAPPWWTVGRLLITLSILFTALLGIFAWNRMLSRLVEKRSRQLAKEEVAHAQAELRAEERTRLSVELHDTIAQNLTGVALQLDSVELAAARDPDSVPKYVANTRQSLQSCREDLRNCLWDLRNRAFEEKTLDSAIRKTLAPHLGGTKLDLAFDVRTTNLADNTVHAILCIVRELAVNAIRHGHAKTLVLRGDRESDGRISFSVRDDGCGFDPKSAPGLDKGHYGLQGIRERVHRLGGTLTITSAAGSGTTAEIRNLSTED